MQQPTKNISPPNRITVRDQIAFRNREDNTNPQSLTVAWSRELTSREQLYVRTTTVDTGWTKLDTGWVGDNCSLIVIVNDEGRFPVKLPTATEREEAKKRIIELAAPAPFCIIHPQEDVRFTPIKPSQISMRSRHGKAKFTIYAYPD